MPFLLSTPPTRHGRTLARFPIDAINFNLDTPSITLFICCFVCLFSLLYFEDTHPFRHFRKASPPMTEVEFERAKSGSRRAAVDRAASLSGPVTQTPSSQQQQQHVQHAGNGVGVAGMTRLQLQQQEFSPSSSICRDSGVLACGGPRAASVGKYLTPRSSTSGSGSPGVVTPFRSRLLNRKRVGGAAREGMRSPSSSGHSPGGSVSTSRSAFAARRSGSGQFSDFSYTAPTAPYQGDDGVSYMFIRGLWL